MRVETATLCALRLRCATPLVTPACGSRSTTCTYVFNGTPSRMVNPNGAIITQAREFDGRLLKASDATGLRRCRTMQRGSCGRSRSLLLSRELLGAKARPRIEVLTEGVDHERLHGRRNNHRRRDGRQLSRVRPRRSRKHDYDNGQVHGGPGWRPLQPLRLRVLFSRHGVRRLPRVYFHFQGAASNE